MRLHGSARASLDLTHAGYKGISDFATSIDPQRARPRDPGPLTTGRPTVDEGSWCASASPVGTRWECASGHFRLFPGKSSHELRCDGTFFAKSAPAEADSEGDSCSRAACPGESATLADGSRGEGDVRFLTDGNDLGFDVQILKARFEVDLRFLYGLLEKVGMGTAKGAEADDH